MQEDNCNKNIMISFHVHIKRIEWYNKLAHLQTSWRTWERTKTTCSSRHFEITAVQANVKLSSTSLRGRGSPSRRAWREINKMAALSARCVRSLARASVQISVGLVDQRCNSSQCKLLTQKFWILSQRTALSANGVSQSKFSNILHDQSCCLQ